MTQRQSDTLKLYSILIGTLISFLAGGNAYFIKRLVDKIDFAAEKASKVDGLTEEMKELKDAIKNHPMYPHHCEWQKRRDFLDSIREANGFYPETRGASKVPPRK